MRWVFIWVCLRRLVVFCTVLFKGALLLLGVGGGSQVLLHGITCLDLSGRGLTTGPGNFNPIGILAILNLLIRVVNNSTSKLPS